MSGQILSIVSRIENQASEGFTRDDLDWISEEVINHFSERFRSYARRAYEERGLSDDIALEAFKSEAFETVRRSCEYFLFKSELWRSNRDFEPYLLRGVKLFANETYREVSGARRVNVAICPACRVFGRKWFLKNEDGVLTCSFCKDSIEYLEGQEGKRTERMEYELRLRRIFASHSRGGCRCPKCERFIPKSFLTSYGVTCPYDDCVWFGTSGELDPMSHPVSMMELSMKHIDGGNHKHGDLPAKSSIDDPLEQLQFKQKTERELILLREVIDQGLEKVKKQKRSKVIKKLLMYRAFKSMVEKNPDDMIAYLVHQNYSGNIPVRAMIFQEYIRLVDNALPFEITPNSKTYEVYSLQDENLDIFHGISVFETMVQEDGIIPNETQETYNMNKCLIGMLCDIEDEDGNSLMGDVDHYTFSNIKLRETKPGVKVRVTHLRLPGHYEMGGLVHLQRVRKDIVNSLKKRKDAQGKGLR